MALVVFDLDDTLYKEIDFLKSSFKKISLSFTSSETEALCLYDNMLKYYYAGENVFDNLMSQFPSVTKKDLLNIYRFHMPNIKLNSDTLSVLDNLKDKNHILGIITDGRSLTQKNKIKALELSKWFSEENIMISEETGHEKPNAHNYALLSNKHPNLRCVYIGDNLNKDFIAPNKLNWDTFCLIDNGNNIHSQIITELPKENYPTHFINNIKELMNYL